MLDILWENEDREVSEFATVPRWIDSDITVGDLAAIVQGGCASGAYMPAVTYHMALATMGEYGDNVLDYISAHGFADMVGRKVQWGEDSWAGIACHIVSAAVEIWAGNTLDCVSDALRGEG